NRPPAHPGRVGRARLHRTGTSPAVGDADRERISFECRPTPQYVPVAMSPDTTHDPTLSAFSRLRVWERDGQRAPHKPLLVLLTLGRWVRGDHGPYRYADIERA